MIINYFQTILKERDNMEQASMKPKRKYTKKKKKTDFAKLNNMPHIDFLKVHFPKQEGEYLANYIHLWANNYRINFHSKKDIRSHFVQIQEDDKGLSYKILE